MFQSLVNEVRIGMHPKTKMNCLNITTPIATHYQVEKKNDFPLLAC